MKKFTLLLCTLLIALAAVVPLSAQTVWNSTQYPDPETQSSSTILPPFFKMKKVGDAYRIPTDDKDGGYGIVGDIVRVIHREHYSYVLTHKDISSHTYEKRTTHAYEARLYFIDHEFDKDANGNFIPRVYKLSLPESKTSNDALAYQDATNPGDYCNLSDIALTADGYLMGCNHIRVYYRVTTMRKRDQNIDNTDPRWNEDKGKNTYEDGTFVIYKWNKSFDELKSLVTTVDLTQFPNQHQYFLPKANYCPTKIVSKDPFSAYKQADNNGQYSDGSTLSWPSANFNRAEPGYTCAVSGRWDGTLWFTFTTTYYHIYSTTELDRNKQEMRFVHVPITNGEIQYADIFVSKKGDGDIALDIVEGTEFDVIGEVGQFYELDASPYNAAGTSWIIDGNKISPYIFTQSSGKYEQGKFVHIGPWATITSELQLQSEYVMGNYPVQNNFFRYGGRNMMVTPYTDYDATTEQETKIMGVRLYDISTKLSAAYPIELSGVELEEPIDFSDIQDINDHIYTSVFPQVEGSDLTLHFFVSYDHKTLGKLHQIHTYTTKGVSQGRGIFAYDLRSEFNESTNEYTFRFKANESPYKALLKLYEKGETSAKRRYKIVDEGRLYSSLCVQKKEGKTHVEPGQEYIVKIPGNQLTLENDSRSAPGTKLTWAVELTDTTVYNMHMQWSEKGTPMTNTEISNIHWNYATLNKSPYSQEFGEMYTTYVNRSDNTLTFKAYNPIQQLINTPTEIKDEKNIKMPSRFAVDSNVLYIPELQDGISNVRIINNPKQVWSIGMYNQNKLWEEDIQKARPASVAIHRKADGKKEMIVYLDSKKDNEKTYEDASNPCYYKHIQFYDYNYTNNKWILNANKTITINEYDYVRTGNSEYNLVPTKDGLFLVSYNTTNNKTKCNNTIMFFKTDGTTPFYESVDQTTEGIDNAFGGGADVTTINNKQYLVVQNRIATDKYSFKVLEFDPEATTSADFFKGDNLYYPNGLTSGCMQLSVDYGGNIWAGTRNYGAAFYSMPKPATSLAGATAANSTNPASIYNTDGTPVIPLIAENDTKYLNRTETPARPIDEFVTEQCDDYDRVFDDATGTGKWEDSGNWIPRGYLPEANHRVRIDQPVTINNTAAVASYIDINTGSEGTNQTSTALTITPTGGLSVGGETPNNPDYDQATDVENKAAKGRIRKVTSKNETVGTNPTKREDREALDAKDILIQAGGTGGDKNTMGSLALHNDGTSAAAPNATVQIDKRYAYNGQTDNANLTWQYIGLPFGTSAAGDFFHRAWMYQWDEAESQWKIISDYYADLNAWQGYLLTSPPENSTYSLAGQLQATGNKTFENLSFEGSETLTGRETEGTPSSYTGYKGANFLANSWTAPIQISELQPEDFTGCDATIYLYAPTKRKYIALPIGTATLVANTNDHIANGTSHQSAAVINPLQGFFVKANNSESTHSLALRYADIVSKDAQPAYVTDATLGEWAGERVKLTEPQSAPSVRIGGDAMNNVSTASARRETPCDDVSTASVLEETPCDDVSTASVLEETPCDDVSTGETDEQPVMRIYVRGTDGNVDNVILIENEAYTIGFDNGYDGRKMAEGGDIPCLTATSNDGDMAVLATPSLYGTFLNFRKGTAQEYTLTFDYNVAESDLVLQDLVTKQSVDIVSGNTYTFTAMESEVKTRFRISHREDSRTEYEPTAYVANNRLYIDNPTNELIGVAVFTVDGKLVQRLTTREVLTDLDVPTQGLYLIEITMSDKVITIKQIL